jgi:hypothetical protein
MSSTISLPLHRLPKLVLAETRYPHLIPVNTFPIPISYTPLQENFQRLYCLCLQSSLEPLRNTSLSYFPDGSPAITQDKL